MDCASCGRANRSGARFCGGCGAALAPRCPACGSECEAHARFCDACGAPLAAPADASVRARSGVPVAEARKVVTIVFADLMGSTALHERLDPESARAFMERYYAAMREAVEAERGQVTQLLGDGVKAVFGAPRVAEDDALRAVRAGVAMQRAFRALADSQREAVGAVGLRVAVNSGEVVAQDEREIIGDPVNVAAHLQQQAGDGDVLLGESTQRIVARQVTLERVGTFALKGRAEPVAAWRVVSLERPAGTAPSAFVGREDELRRILAVYESAAGERRARLAVVLGSPGLGKSRLLAECAVRLGDAASVLVAHCDATGGATFGPLALALRAHLGDAEMDRDAVRAALEAALPGDTAERLRIVEGIAALLAGSPASPEETFFVVRRLLAALAAARPVVLAIDDLQWAEPLLLDLVEHLVQWGADVPLLVLAAARPELRDRRSSLAARSGLVAEALTLGGLDAAAATRLAANAIGADELPAAIAGRVLAASEGNPLFVGELVRMLVQDGALVREGDRFVTRASLAELEMPPTIQALLAARIERLRPEERAVLERAAVVGRHFSRAAVTELLPPELRGDLDLRLEALRRSELIEPDTGWLLGEPVLRFHHVLIRDAAYRRLLKGTRAELHARFADWLAARVGDAPEHDEMQGWHLEQAHVLLCQLGPVDLRGQALGERAAGHLAAAGRRALARDDLSLAAGLLGRALERLAPDSPARAQLALDWCESLIAAGDVGPAERALAELGRLAGDSGRLRAWHVCFAAHLAALTDPQALGDTADAVAAAAQQLAAAGDAAGEAKAHAVHALVLSRLGRIGASEAALDLALSAARRGGDRRRSNAVLAGAPLAALWGPSPVMRASGRCLDVVRVLRITQGAPAVEAVALRCQGVLEALRGRADAARRMVAASRRLVEELGITQRLLEAELFAGRIELLEGDVAAAERCLRTAYDGLRAQGLDIDAARAAALLGRALLAQGRADEAEALSRESAALAGDDRIAGIAWRCVRAEALARRGEHAAGVEIARAAVDLGAATDALLDHADARMALATALRASGRGAEADAEEARAVSLWEAKGATLLVERARGQTRPVPVERADVAAGPAPARRVRANAATANAARMDAAAAARDLVAFRAQIAEDADAVHHPTGAAYLEREGWRQYEVAFANETLAFGHEPIATLGDSLALCAFELALGGGVQASEGGFPAGAADMGGVLIAEVDDRGLRRHTEFFAPDRLGDAIACLYERYACQLPDGPARERAATTARSVATLMGPLDPARYAEALAPDVEYVDRRAVGLGSARGAAALLRGVRTLLETADEFGTRIVDVLGLREQALLTHGVNFGTAAGGGAYETHVLQLWRFGADGRLVRLEELDDDRLDDALARFDALADAASAAPPTAQPRIQNEATRAVDRMRSAVDALDFERAIADLAPDFRSIDRGSMAQVESGRAAYIAGFRRMLAGFSTSRLLCDHLATRGERLALSRSRWVAAGSDVGPSETEWLDLIEIDADRRVVLQVSFDPDDVDAAYAELDLRYAAQEQGGDRRASLTHAFTQAFAARDWDALAALLAPDLVVNDHRRLGWETLRGPGAYVQALQSLVELAPDVALRVDHAAMSDPGYLYFTAWHGTREGGAFEEPSWIVGELDAEGRIRRFDQYGLEQEREARARLAEIGAVGRARDPLSTAPAPAPVHPNQATRARSRLRACVEARDWPALTSLLAPEFQYEDRRPLLGDSGDREKFVASVRVSILAGGQMSRTPLATAGALLELAHTRFAVVRGGDVLSEIEMLQVTEVRAEDGRVAAIVIFDPADRPAADAELRARFEAQRSR